MVDEAGETRRLLTEQRGNSQRIRMGIHQHAADIEKHAARTA
ncbi:hypothetical protein HMPREF1317_0162 [Schaalia georgiae F0490]|uniref:Uncharacterized protein n=1 Tax=Schaalia georgiae F0490 TaxID=1125717 RepID=J1GQV1_9ACTO|nr:hypothetical protein HMPREF1317_0162 [Schaalia georgiae F0490]